jgi:hypothetical protein
VIRVSPIRITEPASREVLVTFFPSTTVPFAES